MVRQKVEGVITLEDKTKKTFGKVESRMGRLGKSFKGGAMVAAKWGAGIATAAAAGAAAVIKVSSEFETGMANISTLLDTNVENMDDMKKEILDLAAKTPKPLNELTESLYDVRSSGVAAEDAMSVLASAADLAVGGLGTTKEATDLLTSAFNSYSAQGYKANQISNILFKTVKNGKTTVAGLAQGFGGIAGLAASAGVKFEELVGATAALTTTGMPASQAYSSLKGVISNIIKPSKAAADMAERLGISFDAQRLKTVGLEGVLDDVRKATGGNVEEMAQLFGSVEGLGAVIALTGGSMEAFKNTMDDLENGVDDLSAAVEKQKATFNAQWTELKNKFSIAMVQIGTVVLPMVIEVMNKVSAGVTWLTEKWAGLSPETQKLITVIGGATVALGALAAVIGVVMALVSPWAIGIAAFVAGLALLMKIAYDAGEMIGASMFDMVQSVKGFFTDVGKAAVLFGESFMEVMGGIWDSTKEGWQSTKDFVSGVWDGMKEASTAFMVALAEIILGKLASINEGWKKTWEGFKGVLKTVWDAILKYLENVINKAISILNKLIEGINKIPGVSIPFIPEVNLVGDQKKREFGGSVGRNEPFLVGERGAEMFVPNTAGRIIPNDKLSGGGGGNITVNISGNSFDSRQRANEVADIVVDKLTRNLELARVGAV